MDSTETAFVDQVADRLKWGVTPGDEGFGDSQHIDRRFVEFDEHAVIDLPKTQQLKHFPRLRADSINTEQ